jgi:2-succinyl-5-enolpyruvyl-6-hydroxy-3-cyclohexene-1-carboxylate synthase
VAGACTSPGSRSTPLVLSLVRDGRIPCWSHIDERAGAFFALGVAKATGRPAVVACTSGTAAANYAPAVHEAREARVPLIVLTADRPAELRDVGAGQVIDQIKLYGDAAKWYVEVDTGEATPERLRWIRQLACKAHATALEGRAGVVHLNFPMREPLVLTEPLPDDEPGTGGGRPDGRPWVARQPAGPDPRHAADALRSVLASAGKGVIVAGREERRTRSGRALAALGAAIGWPVLADPLSGARRGAGAVAHYDALLRHPAFAAAAAPDVVIRAGELPTSKPLRQWLAGLDAVQVALDPEGAWHDPAHDLDLSLAADPYTLVRELGDGDFDAGADPRFLGAWRRSDDLAAAALDAVLGEELSEPRVARELGAGLPADATLVVAASMPVRDVETFFPVRDDPPRVLANRGANGIDGTISTAYGVAAGTDGPVALLLGDVTLAHDLGGLLAAKRLRLPLTIVVVDNGGGGIFDFLPVSATEPHALYEEHIATPTGLDAERVAALFDIGYLPVETVEELRAAVEHGVTSDGTFLIHVRTDRAANVALHRRCWDAVGLALQSG